MASVSSLDQDMRKLRLDRYTPGAANEIRRWIEQTLGRPLQPGDLMDALRDGVALCQLINRAVSPGVKYKESNMPFVQMENISHFLKACEMAPLSLPAHDRFLTVDLYDGKDPAQVLQCIAAFSRRANLVNPSTFPTTIGAKANPASMSPESTGAGAYSTRSPRYTSNDTPTKPIINNTATAFNPLNKAAYSSQGSPPKPSTGSLARGGLATGGPVSSWSSRDDESKTAPAWNIHQYGYMGGASQGNQGVAFGSRRQIISSVPDVPSLAEKEERLKEKIEAEKRAIEENNQRFQAQREEEEARAKEEEEAHWAAETRRLRQQELEAERAEEDRRAREEQSRKEQDIEANMAAARNRQRSESDARLNGQFLSQYKASQTPSQPRPPPRQPVPEPAAEPAATSEAQRIAELERQLAELRRETNDRNLHETELRRIEQEESTQQMRGAFPSSQPQAQPSSLTNPSTTSHEDDWAASERDYLKKAWQNEQTALAEDAPPKPPRPTESSRPLPDPTSYQPNTTRTQRFLATNPAPVTAQPRSSRPDEGLTTEQEQDLEASRRIASQKATKAGGWASKSLLEREMERERERQREWEVEQKQTAARTRDTAEGSGAGQTWDIHQYGYTGGDSQNRGGIGLGTSGARRQIIGPRPPP